MQQQLTTQSDKSNHYYFVYLRYRVAEYNTDTDTDTQNPHNTSGIQSHGLAIITPCMQIVLIYKRVYAILNCIPGIGANVPSD